jgi:hypothetical protein
MLAWCHFSPFGLIILTSNPAFSSPGAVAIGILLRGRKTLSGWPLEGGAHHSGRSKRLGTRPVIASLHRPLSASRDEDAHPQ